jgi:hypothetical protein
MNLLANEFVVFGLICLFKAIMDGLNFTIPKNSGFFSITEGWWDAWHLSWWLILLLISLMFVWDTSNWQISLLEMGSMGIMAFIIQRFVYNFLFKL